MTATGARAPDARAPGATWRNDGAMGLADDDEPCSTKGLIEALANVISPSEFQKAVEEVQRSVCSNYYYHIGLLTSTDCLTYTWPEYGTACNVVVAYMNAAYDRKIPEYAPGAHPVSGQGSPYWPAYDGVVAVETVARLTGLDRNIVAQLLFELYWATQAGRVGDSRYIWPWRFRINKDTLTNTPANTDATKNRGIIDVGFADGLRWAIILGVVGVGAYALTSVAGAVRGVSSMFK